MSLWDLKSGQRASITSIDMEEKSHHQRMLELGFEVGEEIRCIRITPFQSPRVFQIGPSVFSLSKEVALKIQVGELNS